MLAAASPRSCVSFQKGQEGSCLRKRKGEPCGCWPAKYEQWCQSCSKWIREGHCIQKECAGWVHVFCEKDAFRGLPSIRTDLRRARIDAIEDDIDRPSARRRLTYEGDEEEAESDEKTETGEKEEEEVNEEESEDESEESKQEGPEWAGFCTREQKCILAHEPQFGELPVCINALAGCGKTTTIAALSHSLRERYPNEDILYLVFGAKNAAEIKESSKFPKENFESGTAHAFVLRHYFGKQNMHWVKPQGDYSLEDIIAALQLTDFLRRTFPNNIPRKLQRKAKSLATYIRKTLGNFQASCDAKVEQKHIFWRVKNNANLPARSQWRAKIDPVRYVGWASEYFEIIRERCHNVRDRGAGEEGVITYDGYTKVAQLERDLTSNFRFIIADEAQDLTPCQADLFWGDPVVRKERAIYLFGDKHQMLYRFRGVDHSFFNMCLESPHKYNLTGSFRFGEEIAKAASLVLKCIGGGKLAGRAVNPGQIHSGEVFDNQGVVLCRTNQGVYTYLFFHQPQRWCHLGGSKFAFPNPPQWVLALESFLNDEADSFVYRGETLGSLSDIHDYIEDEDDRELKKYLSLLVFLKEYAQQRLCDFRRSILDSFVQFTGNPDDFNGVVVGTVHKAKGLEFSRVLIYDDFNFDVMMSHVISGKLQNDEGSIFYVALTRAKDHLFLTDAAKECLDKLAKFAQAQPLLLKRYRNMKEVREEVARKWQSFKSEKPEVHKLCDIPWPADDPEEDDNLLGLDREMTEAEQRLYIRKLLLQYHPDRFIPVFGKQIACTSLGRRVEGKLNDIVQECMKVLDELQSRGEL